MRLPTKIILPLFAIAISLLFSSTQALAGSVIGKFNKVGNSIELQLMIQQPPPSSIIVELNYQPKAIIKSLKPNTKKINSDSGTLKWHIKKPRVGKTLLSASFDRTIPKNSVRATLQYKSGANGTLQQLVITP